MNTTTSSELIIDQPNKRLKVFNFEGGFDSQEKLQKIAEKKDLEKIILFQKEKSNEELLKDLGFQQEGKIDGYFDGDNAYIFTKYLTKSRRHTETITEEDEIIKTIENGEKKSLRKLPKDYQIRSAKDDDIPQIVDVFNEVFKSYPTPMNDKEYVKKAINSNVEMAVIENGDGIVGLSSAEIDFENKNAEITDCATLPSQRGKGINNHLIQFLEKRMKQIGIVNLFSIARAQSFGMNKVLYNLDYKYRGRLINNVHIAGDWENMNIWVKQV